MPIKNSRKPALLAGAVSSVFNLIYWNLTIVNNPLRFNILGQFILLTYFLLFYISLAIFIAEPIYNFFRFNFGSSMIIGIILGSTISLGLGLLLHTPGAPIGVGDPPVPTILFDPGTYLPYLSILVLAMILQFSIFWYYKRY